MLTITLISLILAAIYLQIACWGSATHIELAEDILADPDQLDPELADLLTRYRHDFLTGNVLADAVIGKKLSLHRRLAHDWTGAFNLLNNAQDHHHKALAYGFLTHLAADTVAHNTYIPSLIEESQSSIGLGHLYWEVRLDQLVSTAHRRTVRRLIKNHRPDHSQIVSDHLCPRIRFYDLNRNVFAGVNRLTNGGKFNKAWTFFQETSRWQLVAQTADHHKAEAKTRMIDLLNKKHQSKLLDQDPNGFATLDDLKKSRRRIRVAI